MKTEIISTCKYCHITSNNNGAKGSPACRISFSDGPPFLLGQLASNTTRIFVFSFSSLITPPVKRLEAEYGMSL